MDPDSSEAHHLQAKAIDDREEQQQPSQQAQSGNPTGVDLTQFGSQFDVDDIAQEHIPGQTLSVGRSTPKAQDSLELGADSSFHKEKAHGSTSNTNDARSGVSRLQLTDTSDFDSLQGVADAQLVLESGVCDKSRL